jgi:XTP/dITP diphosphohydrolase
MDRNDLGQVVLATTNRGKWQEVQKIWTNGELKLVTDLVTDWYVEETGKSYQENALLKARRACDLTGLPSIGEDSGLEVDALDGAPGLYSARFGGEDLDQQGKNLLILSELAQRGASSTASRAARYRCVVAMAFPEKDLRKPLLGEGTVEGRITDSPRGDGGFGYDPLFEVTDPELESLLKEFELIERFSSGASTMAELPAELKNRLSHRYRAFSKLFKQWNLG